MDDGAIRHFCTNGASMAEGVWRGMDLFSPVWNLFDLLPEGRGEWSPSLAYDEARSENRESARKNWQSGRDPPLLSG